MGVPLFDRRIGLPLGAMYSFFRIYSQAVVDCGCEVFNGSWFVRRLGPSCIGGAIDLSTVDPGARQQRGE